MTETKSIPAHTDKLIYEFYVIGRKAGKTYQELADNYNDLYGTNHAESSLRIRYQNYTKNLDDKGELPLPPEETEVKEDGTVIIKNVTKMTAKDAVTPAYILEEKGYEPTEWTVVNYKTSNWGSVDPESKFQNYSVGLTIKPKDQTKFTLEDMIEVNKKYKYVHKPIKVEHFDVNDNNGKALEVALPDLHIGSIASNVDEIKYKVTEIALYAKQTNVEKIFLTFLGDILHVDNTNKTTVKLTQLELEGTFVEMYFKAKDLLNFIVRSFADFEMEVIWVTGNHSEGLEFALFDALKDTWVQSPHIKFDVSEELRKVFKFGDNGTAVTHGNMAKANLFDWFAADFPEVWGEVKFREMHYGHLHSEDVITKGGVVNRRIPTTKSRDDYEYRIGYAETPSVIQTFLYHKTRGMRQIFYW